jgi:hypothetical protein
LQSGILVNIDTWRVWDTGEVAIPAVIEIFLLNISWLNLLNIFISNATGSAPSTRNTSLIPAPFGVNALGV